MASLLIKLAIITRLSLLCCAGGGGFGDSNASGSSRRRSRNRNQHMYMVDPNIPFETLRHLPMEPAIVGARKSDYIREDLPENHPYPRTLHIVGCETREVPPLDLSGTTRGVETPDDAVWGAQAWHQSLLGVERRSTRSRNRLVVHNLCKGKEWSGLSDKVRTYLQFSIDYSKSRNMRSGSNRDVDVFLFADSDVIWSSVDVDVILSRYDRVRAGRDVVVVSSEMSCYAGHRCRQEDLHLFLTNPRIAGIDRPSYSSFINSGIWIASPSAALHLLRDVAKHDAEEMTSREYCDQRGMYGYWNRFPDNLIPDFRQLLFGSLLAVANFHGVNLTRSAYGFTCELELLPKSDKSGAYDMIVRYNRGGDDVSNWAVQSHWIDVQPDHNCSIVRSAGPLKKPFVITDPSFPPAVPPRGNFEPRYPWAEATHELFRTVAPDPVVWHGNGRKPKMLMAFLAKKWFACRASIASAV